MPRPPPWAPKAWRRPVTDVFLSTFLMTLRAGVCRSVLQRHTAPPTLGARLAVDQRQMRAHEECPPVDSEIVFFAPASVVVMLWAAIAAFSKPHEPAWCGLERLSATCHHLLFRSRGRGQCAPEPHHRLRLAPPPPRASIREGCGRGARHPTTLPGSLASGPGARRCSGSMATCTWERASYRPFHTGFRFSANARGPSTTSSLVQSFRTRG